MQVYKTYTHSHTHTHILINPDCNNSDIRHNRELLCTERLKEENAYHLQNESYKIEKWMEMWNKFLNRRK